MFHPSFFALDKSKHDRRLLTWHFASPAPERCLFEPLFVSLPLKEDVATIYFRRPIPKHFTL
ncbi:UNVERIFIED_CONTAM: hypothetical protein FKN15_064974 [Acipenser sinensis]